jgi:hypothetical protein
MHDHDSEENRVEPWKWRCETCDETPVDGEIDVAGIMDFASLAVY